MPKAILSVHDKTGLVEFARGLRDLGWTLIASGGTAKLLHDQQITVTQVAVYTGSPEILGGRVKTLHPAIHGGLLARATDTDRAELRNLGWDYIDLVAVNLYPFKQTIAKPNATDDEAIENIDIGGVTLIRAAAKNHQRVTLVCDPADYAAVLTELRAGGVAPATRKRLAVKGFAHTAHYDAAITRYLSADDTLQITAYRAQSLRYGENPHQSATLYSYELGAGPFGGKVLQGKELSYNNLLDLDAAWRAVVSFDRPTAAFASDTVSAYGGVVASNRAFDGATASALGDLFVECIAAPGFSDDARALLAAKKNCRLLEMPNTQIEPRYELRSIMRGILKQDLDLGDPPSPLSTTGEIERGWKVVSKRAPTEDEWRALRFAWKACQHVKSNAIVFARGEATVGIGGGQPNRVDCVRIAVERAGAKSKGAVMASDAFFPFPDSITVAAQAGITAIAHPGGSQRDAEAIAAADAAGIAMVVTGVRHFRH